MAGKKDIVWIADRIVAQMQTSLSAKLTSLQTEYNDGIVLDSIPNARMFVAEKQVLPALPFLTVIPDRSDAVPLSGESRYDIEYHYLTVAVADGGNIDEERLKKRMARYVRAVEEVCIDNRTLNGSVTDVMVFEKQYAPLLASKTGLLQEGQVSLRVQTHP